MKTIETVTSAVYICYVFDYFTIVNWVRFWENLLFMPKIKMKMPHSKLGKHRAIRKLYPPYGYDLIKQSVVFSLITS